LAPSFCAAAAFAKPLTLTFYQKDKGEATLKRESDVDNSLSSSFSDGESSHASDPSYLNHLRFVFSEEPGRRVHWEPKGAVGQALHWSEQSAITVSNLSASQIYRADYNSAMWMYLTILELKT
jgi:hypothetical protein